MKKFQRHNAAYVALTCKPSKSLARSLSLKREVLALIASYNDIHARALSIAVDYIVEWVEWGTLLNRLKNRQNIVYSKQENRRLSVKENGQCVASSVKVRQGAKQEICL